MRRFLMASAAILACSPAFAQQLSAQDEQYLADEVAAAQGANEAERSALLHLKTDLQGLISLQKKDQDDLAASRSQTDWLWQNFGAPTYVPRGQPGPK